MRIALVHDFLAQDGGAEKVLKAFEQIYPQAPIFTLIHDKKRLGDQFSVQKVNTSFIQKLPLGVKKYQWYLPMMPLATERHNLTDYDVILSSSSAFAKGVITRPETLHICYCHTPTRYLWTDTHTYVKELGYNRLVKKLIPFVLTNIRLWDSMTADRVDHFIANSKTVQDRIAKFYRRDSKIIHPPVDTNSFNLNPAPGKYFLAGGRLVAYKRFDLLVRAFNRLGIKLNIFGEGPELDQLRSKAKPNITFLGKVDNDTLAALYQNCIAFLHPQEEDFGITAVEAMSAGKPVIAYSRGGALETVIDGETGTFFHEQAWEAIADSVIRFQPELYDPHHIRNHARRFSTDNFQTKMKSYIDQQWQAFQEKDALLNAVNRQHRLMV